MRVRYRYISLQLGYNIQLPRKMKFVNLRTKIQNYYKKLLPALRIATLVARTRRDEQLYDEAQGIRLCQTCWSDDPEHNTPSYDAALYDLTLQDAVTVLPHFKPPVDDSIADELPPSPPLPDSSTQEAISFEKYYGVPQAEAWPIFDQLDPLVWFQQEKALADTFFFSQGSQLTIQRAKEAAMTVQYKLPSVCLIARAGPPSFSDMHGAFLSGGKNSNDAPIVIDTGASISITPYRSDIISDLEECDVVLHGLSDTVKVEGIGWVEWSIQDTFGQVAKIRTRAYLVPEGHVRLLSPQHYFKLYEDDASVVVKPKCEFDAHWLQLHTVDGNILKLPFDSGNNLPYAFLDVHSCTPDPSAHLSAYLHKNAGQAFVDARNLILDSNHNMTPPQKELQLWHQRLGHLGYQWVQDLMRKHKQVVGEPPDHPIIPTREDKVSTCDAPKCAACQLAKQHLQVLAIPRRR